MSGSSVKKYLLFPALLALAACQAQQQVAAPASGLPTGEPSVEALAVRVLPDAELFPGRDRQQMIADTLYEGLQALTEDRLLTPVDDSAHARFMRVLAYEPDNTIALQGLQDIVKRYLQLSKESMHRGLFDEAKTMLSRASFVDADHPDIPAVVIELEQEMNSSDLFFSLDYPQLVARSEQVQQQLADIANQAREHEAFFLITAPNDELARWMVSVMREAVSGYRLRGNIELASRAGIRLRMPVTE
jgi:hypothetical protein